MADFNPRSQLQCDGAHGSPGTPQAPQQREPAGNPLPEGGCAARQAGKRGNQRSHLSPASAPSGVAFRKSSPPLGTCNTREKHKLHSEEKNPLTFNSSKSLENLILTQNTPGMMSLGQRHITDQKFQQELFRDSSFLAVQLPHFKNTASVMF